MATLLINVMLIKVLIKIQIFDLKHRIIFFSEVASINFIFINIIVHNKLYKFVYNYKVVIRISYAYKK